MCGRKGNGKKKLQQQNQGEAIPPYSSLKINVAEGPFFRSFLIDPAKLFLQTPYPSRRDFAQAFFSAALQNIGLESRTRVDQKI
jgi:hypothetical protein